MITIWLFRLGRLSFGSLLLFPAGEHFHFGYVETGNPRLGEKFKTKITTMDLLKMDPVAQQNAIDKMTLEDCSKFVSEFITGKMNVLEMLMAMRVLHLIQTQVEKLAADWFNVSGDRITCTDKYFEDVKNPANLHKISTLYEILTHKKSGAPAGTTSKG